MQSDLILIYLDLLLKWNEKINLTSIRDPETCVTRHFGESLLLIRHASLRGSLLDIGSGAGFPGLALKIVFPELSVTLLEPVAKKRAFLKEAARACGFTRVQVLADRIEDFSRSQVAPVFETATSRAVGHHDEMLPFVAGCLQPGGKLYLWLTRDHGPGVSKLSDGIEWGSPIPIPGSERNVIWPGTKRP